MWLTPELEALKRRFIVPVETIANRAKPKHLGSISDRYYCPYAPCCSQCKAIFTLREAVTHLRRIHDKTSVEIKKLLLIGLPFVTRRRKSRRSKIFYENRNQDMVLVYQSGEMTLEQVGKHFGLTKGRVQQIVAKALKEQT